MARSRIYQAEWGLKESSPLPSYLFMSNCLSRKSPRQTSHLHLFIFDPPFYTSLVSSNASCLFVFFNLIHTKLKVSWYWWMKFGTSKTYPKGKKLWWWTSGRATSGYCSEADESRQFSQVSLNANYTAWLWSFEYTHILVCLDQNPRFAAYIHSVAAVEAYLGTTLPVLVSSSPWLKK